jgi:hypothetical protein
MSGKNQRAQLHLTCYQASLALPQLLCRCLENAALFFAKMRLEKTKGGWCLCVCVCVFFLGGSCLIF